MEFESFVKCHNKELSTPHFTENKRDPKKKKDGLKKKVGLFMEEASYSYKMYLDCLQK